MSGKGFEIDKAAVRRLSKELQHELNKNPVQIPVRANAPVLGTPEHRMHLVAQALYDAGAVDENSAVFLKDLDLNLEATMLAQARQLLSDENLIDSASLAGDTFLTSLGRRFVTDPVAGPRVVHNDFSQSTFIHSPVTAAGSIMAASQIPTEAVDLLQQVLSVITQFDTSHLTDDQQDEFDADLSLLEQQANDPSVRRKGLRRAVGTVRDVVVSASGSAAGDQLLQLLRRLPEFL